MIHLIDLIIQWYTKGELPSITIAWWLDVLVTLAGIFLIFIICFYADKRMQRLQEHEKAIDNLIETHENKGRGK